MRVTFTPTRSHPATDQGGSIPACATRTSSCASAPRTRLLTCLALALLPGITLAEGDAPPSLDFTGGSLTYEAHGSRTLLTITTADGRHYSISLSRDSTVARNVPPQQLTLVGQLDTRVLILTDSYPSIPGGLQYCEAGEEKFLRVISLVRKSAAQTYHTKLESCRQNLMLADPGLEWTPDQETLAIHWSSSSKGVAQPDNRTLKIGPKDVTVQR